MAPTRSTTEAALQAGLLPAQERREGRFAKVSGRLKPWVYQPKLAAVSLEQIKADLSDWFQRFL